jgi:hypothetical protein
MYWLCCCGLKLVVCSGSAFTTFGMVPQAESQSHVSSPSKTILGGIFILHTDTPDADYSLTDAARGNNEDP